MALSLLCLVIGLLGFLLLVMKRAPQRSADSLDQIWQRFERGDLTQDEIERLSGSSRE